MRRHEAKALEARNPLDLANQVGEAATPGRVCVVVDVLAQQHDLFGAVGHGLPALRDNRVHREVALAAAHLRHDAERAVVVAPLDHAHVVADSGASGLGQRLAL